LLIVDVVENKDWTQFSVMKSLVSNLCLMICKTKSEYWSGIVKLTSKKQKTATEKSAKESITQKFT